MEGTAMNHHQPEQHNTSAQTQSTQSNEGSNAPARLDYMAVKNAAMTLRAINHKLRQSIIKLLEENKRMNVTDIYVKLRLEQSVASQHLAILRRAGIVNTERTGKFIHYSLNNERIREIEHFVEELMASGERHIKPSTRGSRQENNNGYDNDNNNQSQATEHSYAGQQQAEAPVTQG